MDCQQEDSARSFRYSLYILESGYWHFSGEALTNRSAVRYPCAFCCRCNVRWSLETPPALGSGSGGLYNSFSLNSIMLPFATIAVRMD
eukprot:1029560-Pyramimonas_sp.AAC.1